MSEFAATIDKIRTRAMSDRGYAQELSFESRVAYSVVWKILNGTTESPRIKTFEKIVAAAERLDAKEKNKTKQKAVK